MTKPRNILQKESEGKGSIYGEGMEGKPTRYIGDPSRLQQPCPNPERQSHSCHAHLTCLDPGCPAVHPLCRLASKVANVTTAPFPPSRWECKAEVIDFGYPRSIEIQVDHLLAVKSPTSHKASKGCHVCWLVQHSTLVAKA